MTSDLILFLTSPVGEEIFLALMVFISIFLMLWLLSKIFRFKKQDYKTALLIATIIAATSFVIRSISLVFSLKDAQKPPINLTAMIVEALLLLILIKKNYDLKWLKTIGIWILIYPWRWIFTAFITIIMLMSFPTLGQHDPTPTVKAGISDFEIENINEIGSKIGDNQFAIYRNKIVTPTSIRVVNLVSNIAFNQRTEGVYMDLECMTPEKTLFSSIQNSKIDEWAAGKQYEFGSEDKYRSFFKGDLSFNYWGYAHLSCDLVCNREAKTFNFKNIFNKSEDFTSSYIIAEMDTGKFVGTKMLHIERRKPMKVHIDFVFEGNENTTIDCNAYIITENPPEKIKKSFTIKYIAD